MTERSLAKLACRVLALYAFFRVVTSLPTSVIALSLQRGDAALSTPLTSTLLAVTAGVLLGNLLTGSVLWLGASRIAGWMAPEENLPEGLEYRSLQTLAFSVVGLVLVVEAVVFLGSFLAYLLDIQITDGGEALIGLTGQTIGFVLGLSLLLKSKGLVSMLHGTSRSGMRED